MREAQQGPESKKAPSQKAPPAKRRVRVKTPKADSLRRVRKLKTFAGYGLVFIVLLLSVLLSLGGVQTLGNALILVAAFWGIIWWRINPRFYARFVGDVATCPECGSEVDLVDAWRCPACGLASNKHVLQPCEKCGTRGGKLACSSCGSSISV